MASELSKFIEDELAEKGVTADDSERLLGALRVEARQKEQLKKQKFKSTCRNLTIVCGIVIIVIIWLVLAFNNNGIKSPAEATIPQTKSQDATDKQVTKPKGSEQTDQKASGGTDTAEEGKKAKEIEQAEDPGKEKEDQENSNEAKPGDETSKDNDDSGEGDGKDDAGNSPPRRSMLVKMATLRQG